MIKANISLGTNQSRPVHTLGSAVTGSFISAYQIYRVTGRRPILYARTRMTRVRSLSGTTTVLHDTDIACIHFIRLYFYWTLNLNCFFFYYVSDDGYDVSGLTSLFVLFYCAYFGVV